MMVQGIDVHVTRKRIKNLRIRVMPQDGHVEASVPLYMPLNRVEHFIGQKIDWIIDQQQQAAVSPRHVAACATDEQLAEWRTVVEAAVPLLIERWEPIMRVRSGKIAYRNMTSRWGSCQPSTGRICINIRLALYPPQCLELIVVHELCHLLESGHGPKFKQLMDLFLPDWRDRQAILDRG